MNEKIVKLTGRPVSDGMLDILERLGRKEDVPIDEIEDTKEMKTARLFVPAIRDTIDLKGREEIQEAIGNEMMRLGSAVKDGDNVRYAGQVEQNARLDIVIGLSASGKSSALVDVLSQEFHSRVIDNDMVKAKIPEFCNGWDAGVVHKESQMISDQVYDMALERHDNIILPKVGSSPHKLLTDYIMPAKEKGYEVNLHFIDLDRNKAMGRLLNRYIETGRFLDPKLIDKYAPTSERNKVARTYEVLKDDGRIHGSSKWDNDVPRGTRPILLEYRNLDGNFIDTAVTKGADINGRYMQDGGRSRRSDAQRSNVETTAQRRVGPIDAQGEKPDHEHSVQNRIVCGGTSQNGRRRDACTMGGTGNTIELTEADLKGLSGPDSWIL